MPKAARQAWSYTVVEHPEALGEGFSALSQFFVNDSTLGETLLWIAELAREEASADIAALTMLVDGKPGTVVYTDPEALTIDESQYSTGQGPCVDAFLHDRVNRIDSTIDDDRWPDFARTAASSGVLSTLSVPLGARGETLAALNLYSRTKAAFGDRTVERIGEFTGQASIVLANAQVYWDARQLNENLRQSMESRAVIDFAIGIILAQGGRTPEEAFQTLVRASQRENRKLREIAAELVERASTRPGPSAGD
jgi:GAF domain-containing protein